MKTFVKKHPVAYGLVLGYGCSLLFVLLEYALVTTGLSECGVWVDSCLRIVFGAAALVLLKIFYQDRFKSLFTRHIPAKTWLILIPFGVYCAVELLYFTIAKAYTMQYFGLFLAVCVQQLATGLFEESASRGLVMSGMLDKWKDSVKGRIGMVALSGVLFGTLHLWNVLFSNDWESCLWQALYTALWGMFLAAVYWYAGNLLLCMSLHAVWDIAIRIWDYFCVGINSGLMLTCIRTAEDIIELGIFPILAIVICIKYKPREKETISWRYSKKS